MADSVIHFAARRHHKLTIVPCSPNRSFGDRIFWTEDLAKVTCPDCTVLLGKKGESVEDLLSAADRCAAPEVEKKDLERSVWALDHHWVIRTKMGGDGKNYPFLIPPTDRAYGYQINQAEGGRYILSAPARAAIDAARSEG